MKNEELINKIEKSTLDKFPIYGKINYSIGKTYGIFAISGRASAHNSCDIYITKFNTLSVAYDYNVPNNTYANDETKEITKEEFRQLRIKMGNEHGIKIAMPPIFKTL